MQPFPGDSRAFRRARKSMVAEQIARRGVSDRLVLAAMQRVPRHQFVDPAYHDEAYADHPLPLVAGQTISQPYIVAYMTELLQLRGGERVLEIGTGCGYQTAVLLAMNALVYSVEIVPELCRLAERNLMALGFVDGQRLTLRQGNGRDGWPEESPFDRVLVAAAAEKPPRALAAQLKIGGSLLAPIGANRQQLVHITRTLEGFTTRADIPVRFVPLIDEPAQSH